MYKSHIVLLSRDSLYFIASFGPPVLLEVLVLFAVRVLATGVADWEDSCVGVAPVVKVGIGIRGLVMGFERIESSVVALAPLAVAVCDLDSSNLNFLKGESISCGEKGWLLGRGNFLFCVS